MSLWLQDLGILFKLYIILLRTQSWTDSVDWTYKNWGGRRGEKFNIVTYWGIFNISIPRYTLLLLLVWFVISWYILCTFNIALGLIPGTMINLQMVWNLIHLKKKYKAVARDRTLNPSKILYAFQTSHRKFILDQQ